MNYHKMKAIKYILFTLLVLYTINTKAQLFKWEAELPQVEKAGFYRIFLHPKITTKLQRHYPDIRIFNQNGKKIPFLYQSENINNRNDSLIPLKIINKKHKFIKSYTTLTIENYPQRNINNFIFLTDNKIFRKWVKISASNNKKKWYVIKDNFPAQIEYSDSAQTELIINNLPESNFNYYKIVFYDYDNQRVKIHEAYTSKSDSTQLNYISLPPMQITHKDTMEHTIVNLSFEQAQFVDRIYFEIDGPGLFFRNAILQKPARRAEREKKMYYDELNKQLILSSEKVNIINLSHFKIKDLKLTIDNRNNQALRIRKAIAWQKKKYITAYLNPYDKYFLRFGDPQTYFPVYDLEYFKYKIQKDIPILKTKQIKKLRDNKPKLFSSDIWNMPLYYLWTGMGLLGIVLLIITIRMLKQQYKNSRK